MKFIQVVLLFQTRYYYDGFCYSNEGGVRLLLRRLNRLLVSRHWSRSSAMFNVSSFGPNIINYIVKGASLIWWKRRGQSLACRTSAHCRELLHSNTPSARQASGMKRTSQVLIYKTNEANECQFIYSAVESSKIRNKLTWRWELIQSVDLIKRASSRRF